MSGPNSTITTTTTTSPLTRALLVRLSPLPASPNLTTGKIQAGALAGTTVDLSLYPLDTLKTRLQSPHGFYASGGFRGIYSGIGSCLSSAPSGALFFLTYESVKSYLSVRSRRDGDEGGSGRMIVEQMLAASAGEVVSCIIRVPTEVVKQRAQAGQYPSSVAALRGILNQRGQFGWSGVLGSRGFYRGFGITIMREVPFTVIQFPLWEGMKTWWMVRKNSNTRPGGKEEVLISAAESAVFGSISGAGAAAVTTPLDVLKTRVMLAQTRVPVGEMFMYIWRNEGPRTFLKGIGPRMMWISLGGAVFLGSWQWGVNALS